MLYGPEGDTSPFVGLAFVPVVDQAALQSVEVGVKCLGVRRLVVDVRVAD